MDTGITQSTDGRFSLVPIEELSRLREASLELAVTKRALARVKKGWPDLYRVIELETKQVEDDLPF